MVMKNKTTEPFVALPRKLRDQLAGGIINFNEFSVLSLIYIITNPVNGMAIVSYQQLSIETKIKEPYIRKIIRNLASHKLVWFKPHRGRGGAFPLWVDGYVKSKGLNDIEQIKKFELNANHQTNYIPTNSQVDTQPDNAFHNSKEVKVTSKDQSSISNKTVFTTTHNNNDNDNDKDNIYIEKNKKKYGLDELRRDVHSGEYNKFKQDKENLINKLSLK